MRASYKDKEMIYNNRKLIIKRGQFIISRKKMAKETGVQESKVERVLKYLKSEQMIEQQNLHTSRLITITNYDKYQSHEQVDEQPVNSQRTASEQPVNTIKKDKKDKNKNKNKSIVLQIITHLNKKAQTKYSPGSKGNHSFINARIKEGFALNNFIHVIDVKCQEWIGTEQEQYLRPETLFCKKHFESYLNQKQKQKKESWAVRSERKEREKQ
jgi:uncharacterized phage protein (TIGR02220 family)